MGTRCWDPVFHPPDLCTYFDLSLSRPNLTSTALTCFPPCFTSQTLEDTFRAELSQQDQFYASDVHEDTELPDHLPEDLNNSYYRANGSYDPDMQYPPSHPRRLADAYPWLGCDMSLRYSQETSHLCTGVLACLVWGVRSRWERSPVIVLKKVYKMINRNVVLNAWVPCLIGLVLNLREQF